MALQVLALMGYLAFLLATFGWSTVQARRTTGESRWREPISRVDAIGETVCVMGCLLTIVAPLLALLGVAQPIPMKWLAVQAFMSVACLGSGTSLAIRAQNHLGEQWRAGVEASASLVTDGPFARTRNPFYLGCILASAGVLMAVPSGVALAGLALHIVAAEIIVRGVEEPILTQAHGDAFLRYQQQTGRFVPRRAR